MASRGRSSSCYVVGCNSGYGSQKTFIKRTGGKAPSFFRPPSDEARKQWEKVIRRADKELTMKDVVCEKHFKEEEIEREYVTKLPNGDVWHLKRGSPKLKLGVIPSIFPNYPNYLKPKVTVKRKDPVQRALKSDLLSKRKRTMPAAVEDQGSMLQPIDSIIQKNTVDKKPWLPKKTDRVCSDHFIGKVKSNIESSPSYYPTIFPWESKTKTFCPTERFERAANLNKKRASTQRKLELDPEHEFGHETNAQVTSSASQSACSISCQVNFIDLEDSIPNNNFQFECYFTKENCDVGVQASIVNTANIKHTLDKCVGNCDNIKCSGFHGFASVSKDEEMSSLCGVSFVGFSLLLGHLGGEHGNEKLSKENKLLMFLMKLKLGISNRALAVFFGLHCTSVSRIFLTVLNELFKKTSNYIYWPSRSVISKTMPKSFQLHYPDCRVIIDCTEIKIELPKSVENQVYTYSHYKGGFTAKFLLGIAPNGFITYISDCYGGRSSDSFITNNCGILNLLEPNDKVLADKGFPGIKCNDNVVIVMPPFVHDGMLTVEEVEQSYSIASVRIHVERSIQRIKTYNILQKISHSLFPYIDMVVQMCAILTNLQPPIIKDDDEE